MLRAGPLALIAATSLITAGCVELGVVSDGTSVSLGKPGNGKIASGVRLPDRGAGYFTRERWRERNNRYGTDELVGLIQAVAKRVHASAREPRLVVADLSGRGGGPVHTWPRSHPSGRDVDLVYFMLDQDGKPIEAETMYELAPDGTALDGSGLRIDIARTWRLVKELVTAHEATVQFVFMYGPFAELLAEHATRIGEPAPLIARARKAMRQPGDSAPHNDHIHVRIYCPAADRAFGCQDSGPLDLLVEREAELAAMDAASRNAPVDAITPALPPSS
ncbi:MAG: penicillin-insensitive murein endopeptidase [Kofleriaceae bacterium]